MDALRSVLFAAVVGLTATAQADPAAAQTPRRGGVFAYVIVGDPATLDCHQSGSVYVTSAVAPVYSNLVKYDPANYPTIVGDLAESWTVSPDGLTYTFKLRPNVKFHDGASFSADDIKATFDRLRNPPTGVVSIRRSDFADVASIDVVDPQTVAFRLAQRNTAMLDAIANPLNCVYSARKLAADPGYPATTPMGTGAFTFDLQVRGERIEGKRFAGYFRPDRPYLDGYKVVSVSAPSYANAFISGQVDAALATLQPVEIENARRAFGDKLKLPNSISGTLTFLSFNHERKPFDDVRVRRAITMAVDRRNGIDAMRRITNFVAYGGVLRPGAPMSLPEAELSKLPGFAPDVAAARAEARRLLAEAGQSNLKIKLLARNETNIVNLGIFSIAQMKEIGIEMTQDNLEAPIYLQRLGVRDFEMAYEGDGGAASDPAYILTKFLPGSPSNFAKISDPMLTDLFNRQKGAIDRGEREKLINAYEGRVLSEAMFVPMFWAGVTVGLRDYVNGWNVTPNFILGYDLVNVWRSE